MLDRQKSYFASWRAITSSQAKLGERTLDAFFHRLAEELYDLKIELEELRNLAVNPNHKDVLVKMRAETERFQARTDDPLVQL